MSPPIPHQERARLFLRGREGLGINELGVLRRLFKNFQQVSLIDLRAQIAAGGQLELGTYGRQFAERLQADAHAQGLPIDLELVASD